jgi:hypothetical protein
MILQFQNQKDLEEFIKLVDKQTFPNLKKLTVIMSHDEAALDLAINAFHATVVNSPDKLNNISLD